MVKPIREIFKAQTLMGRALRAPRDIVLRGPLTGIRQGQQRFRKEMLDEQKRLREEMSGIYEELSRLRDEVGNLSQAGTGLRIPEKFKKHAAHIDALGTPAETGAMLIEYMCQRLGIADLGKTDVLDFGCGCRFADAIVNKELPIGRYTGIDIDKEMIEFLSRNVSDTRLAFYYWDVQNPLYNPNGEALTSNSSLPVGERDFDLICMFSVITHQLPDDAENLLRILRRYVRPEGRLFFSANIQDMDGDYREMAHRPTLHSAYSAAFLQGLLARTGWKCLSLEGKTPQGVPIQDSFLCAPV